MFGPLPALVAREARRIRERHERGEPLDDVVGSATGTDLMALVASYGSFDAVPEPVQEALEAAAQRAGERGMGERDADLIRRFHHITITDAFEILNEGDEE